MKIAKDNLNGSHLFLLTEEAATPNSIARCVAINGTNRIDPRAVNSAVVWGTPPGVAPMAAIVHTLGVEVTLGSGQVVTSRPMTLLLSSEPGVEFAQPGPSAELHRKLIALPGARSAGV